jgi:hypothetical protein
LTHFRGRLILCCKIAYQEMSLVPLQQQIVH